MQQLVPPSQDPVDLAVLTARHDRTPAEGRPWLMANMVMSVDGAYSLEGRSGGLGGDADRLVFRWLRAAADVVLVAAGTARAENYRRPTLPAELVEHRRLLGLDPTPRLCLVTRSLDVPDGLPFLAGDGPEPLVAHPEGLSGDALPDGVCPMPVPEAADGVDPEALLVALRRDHGARVVLCEGGPSLLGALHRRDLVDELFVTVSPVMVGGERTGLLGRGDPVLRHRRLHRLLAEDGTLFCTYRRAD